MIRKILGFLPAGFWTVMLYFGGIEFMNPMYTGWRITSVPLNIWVYFGLSVLSGVLLCVKGMIPIGLIVGIIPGGYLLIGFLAGGLYGGTPVPAMLTLFYVIYAVCYYTYHHELNKP